MLGLVRDDSFTDFGNGPVYVSTTEGALTTDVSGFGTDDVIQVVGHAIGADLLFVQPCLTTMEHA